MPGDAPLDGSPDPTGLEPDPYDLEDASRRTVGWSDQFATSHARPRKRAFNPVTDPYNSDLEWLLDPPPRVLKVLLHCGICDRERDVEDFPWEDPFAPGARVLECVDCLDFLPGEELMIALPLYSRAWTDLHWSVAALVHDIWILIDPTAQYALLLSPYYGTRDGGDPADRLVSEWEDCFIVPTIPVETFLAERHFARIVQEGVLAVDLPRFEDAAAYDYILLVS